MADLTTSFPPTSTAFNYNATNASSSFMTSQGEQTTTTGQGDTTPIVPGATTTVAPPPAVITQAIVAITTTILQTTAGKVVTVASTSTSTGLTTTQLVIVILGSLAAIPALIALLCMLRACIKCCIHRSKVQPEMIPVGQRRDDEDVGYLYQTKPGFANGRASLSQNIMTTAQSDPPPRPIVVPPYVPNIRSPQSE